MIYHIHKTDRALEETWEKVTEKFKDLDKLTEDTKKFRLLNRYNKPPLLCVAIKYNLIKINNLEHLKARYQNYPEYKQTQIVEEKRQESQREPEKQVTHQTEEQCDDIMARAKKYGIRIISKEVTVEQRRELERRWEEEEQYRGGLINK